MMNSLELAYQMRRLSVDSGSSSLAPPPALASSADMGSFPADFELDCSGFDNLTPATSYASMSSGSLSSASHNGLSRSRCVHNLSSLGCDAAEDYRPVASYASRSNEPAWGYYVDTPSR